MLTIDISEDTATLSGYVVDATQPNIENYLNKHTDFTAPLMRQLRSKGSKVALLSNLYVEEDQRGTGLGTALVKEFLDQSENAGASAYILICDTCESQIAGFDLQKWYESFGFVAILNTSGGPLMVMPEHLANEIMLTGL